MQNRTNLALVRAASALNRLACIVGVRRYDPPTHWTEEAAIGPSWAEPEGAAIDAFPETADREPAAACWTALGIAIGRPKCSIDRHQRPTYTTHYITDPSTGTNRQPTVSR